MVKIDPKVVNKAALSNACMEALREGSAYIDRDQPFEYVITFGPDLVLKNTLNRLPRAEEETAERKEWKPILPG